MSGSGSEAKSSSSSSHEGSSASAQSGEDVTVTGDVNSIPTITVDSVPVDVNTFMPVVPSDSDVANAQNACRKSFFSSNFKGYRTPELGTNGGTRG